MLSNGFKTENLGNLFQRTDVCAGSVIAQEKLSVEYYHLLEKSALHVSLPEPLGMEPFPTLYYLVLVGKVQIMKGLDKLVLHNYDLLTVNGETSFDIYALEESSLLLITSSPTASDNLSDELSKLIQKVEKNDIYLKGHNLRVGNYANLIMSSLVPGYDSNDCFLAGAYHDVGKSQINPKIFSKRGMLNAEERNELKMHTVYAYKIIEPKFGARAAYFARWHHERLDGSGYPDGLTADKLPLEARAVAVADAFDSLVSLKNKNERRTVKEALSVLDKQVRAKKLDKNCVAVLKELLKSKQIDPNAN